MFDNTMYINTILKYMILTFCISFTIMRGTFLFLLSVFFFKDHNQREQEFENLTVVEGDLVLLQCGLKYRIWDEEVSCIMFT